MKQAAVYVQGQGSIIAGWLDTDDRYIIMRSLRLCHGDLDVRNWSTRPTKLGSPCKNYSVLEQVVAYSTRATRLSCRPELEKPYLEQIQDAQILSN
jgi:hypothetical protein